MPSESKAESKEEESKSPIQGVSHGGRVSRRVSMSSNPIKDELIMALIEWGTSPAFENELSSWMSSNCAPFATAASAADEQTLECGDAFVRYCAWFDDALSDFCKDHAVEPAEVSRRMSDVLSLHADDEFFPAFMSITEYESFRAQMYSIAVKRDLQ